MFHIFDYSFGSAEGKKRLETMCGDPDVTLEEVLSDANFTQEARNGNGKVVT